MIFRKKGGGVQQPADAERKGKRMPTREEIGAFKKIVEECKGPFSGIPESAEGRKEARMRFSEKLIEELKQEGERREKGRLRNFLRRQKERIKTIGIAAAISALSVFGTMSPVPLEKITGYGYSAESAREEAMKKGWGYDDAKYLAQIFHEAWFSISPDGRYMTSEDILKGIVSSPKFEQRMLPFLGIMFLEKREEKQMQINGSVWLRDFLSSEDFDPEVVMGAIRAYDELGGDIYEHISKLGRYRAIDADGYIYIRNIARAEYEDLLKDVTNLLRNPNFAEKPIGREDFKMIASSLNDYSYFMRHQKGVLFREIRYVISAYYANPEFGKGGGLDRLGPSAFAEKIFNIYRGLGATEYGKLSFLLAGFMENPNFSEKDVTEQNVRRLYKLCQTMGERFTEEDWNAAYGFAKSRISYPPSDKNGKFQIERIIGWAGKKDDSVRAAPVPRWMRVEEVPGKIESSLKISRSLAGRSGGIDEKKAAKIWKDLDFFSRRLWEKDLADIAEMGASKPEEFAKIYDTYCSENRKKCWEALDAITDIRAALGNDGWERGYAPLLEDVLYAKRKDAPAQTMYSALSKSKPVLSIKKSVLGNYEEGKALAKKLGAPKTVATWINFAYGLSVIGEEETERLYREFGIEYFTRYNTVYRARNHYVLDALSEISQNSKGGAGSSENIALIATAKSDWNGALESVGNNFSQLALKYRVFAVEVKGDWELFERIRHVSSKYGRLGVMLVKGHGDPLAIQLGDGHSSASDLDNRDYCGLASINSSFSRDPKIILYACNSGCWNKGGVAHIISKALKGSTVFAPGSEPYGVEIRCGTEGKIGVQYGGAECKVFCERDKGHTKLDSLNFQREINEGIVLVDFWAPWCGPCKMLMPVFEDLSETMPDVKFAKVNTDDNDELSEKLAISSIPTLILFRDGKEIARRSGSSSKEELEKWVLSTIGQAD